jgi:uncharacterized protein YdgA (DUF945 family)
MREESKVFEEVRVRVELEQFERIEEGGLEMKLGNAANARAANSEISEEGKFVDLRNDSSAALVDFESGEVGENDGSVDVGHGARIACRVRKVDR